MPPKFKPVIFSFAAFLVAGFLSYLWQSATGISDIYFRLCIARSFLGGVNNPYSTCMQYNFGSPAAEYPFTTILFLAPLSFLQDRLAASIFWGLSSGLLLFGILKRGERRYLLIFLSGAYWTAFMWQQFSVIIAAVMLLPGLLPLVLIKPQIGLPVLIINAARRRLIACAIFIALTFAVYPHWLFDWFERSRNYNGLIPLLFLPLGPLLALTLLKWREKNALFLLLMALMPQRTLMDTTALFLIPQSARSMAILCLLSWVPAWKFILDPASGNIQSNMPWLLLFIYFPALMMVLRQPRKPNTKRNADRGGQQVGELGKDDEKENGDPIHFNN